MKFSPRDLFWAVTLIAVGVGCGSRLMRAARTDESFALLTASYVVGSSLIGAGIGALFRHIALGAMVGPLISLLLFVLRQVDLGL